MTPEFLEKIIQLVRERGDKFIIVNPSEKSAVVVMPFSEYEKTASLSVSSLSSKIAADSLTKASDADRIDYEIADFARTQGQKTAERAPKAGQELFPSAAVNKDDWGGDEFVEDILENDPIQSHYFMEPLE